MGDRSAYKEVTSVVIPVKNVIVHPQLSVVGAVQNDLALLHLLYPVNFTVTIQPVCIPQKTFQVEAGTTCWVTGWGKKEHGEIVRQVACSGRGRQPSPEVGRKAKERGRKEDCLVEGEGGGSEFSSGQSNGSWLT